VTLVVVVVVVVLLLLLLRGAAQPHLAPTGYSSRPAARVQLPAGYQPHQNVVRSMHWLQWW
jgi:hypothetical protein